MIDARSGLRAALFLFALAASAGAGALAQQAEPAAQQPPAQGTVGPPALKDFSLPGQRTTPPAEPAPSQQPAAQPPAEAAEPPAPRAETRPETPRPAAPVRTGTPRAETPEAETAPAAPVVPIPEPSVPAAEIADPVLPAAPAGTPALAPAPASQATEGAGWLWPLAALLVAGLAIFLFLRLSRNAGTRREAFAGVPAERESLPEAAPPAAPKPVAKPALPAATAAKARPAPAPVAEGPRPWLELSIRADRAAATETEALIQYDLLLDNAGDETARNIRISAKLFNAGAEGDIHAFFQAPLHEKSGSPHIVVEPGKGIRLGGQVSLPLAEVRQIEVQGRRLFIPMVAISVAYDWGESGRGRTSKSWLVGRESEPAAEKMGAFRLDLGPRIYRSVGQRVAQLVKV